MNENVLPAHEAPAPADSLTAPELTTWPPRAGFRRYEASRRLGAGDAVWADARRSVLSWAVKTRSGFDVSTAEPVAAGQRLHVTARVLGVTVVEPIEVVTVVDSATRTGFAYRTRKGHPIDGEEAFVVHREGGAVFLTVRSLSRPARTRGWRMLYPLLLVAQAVAHRRYLRSLG